MSQKVRPKVASLNKHSSKNIEVDDDNDVRLRDKGNKQINK